jgi:hypothetical protein
MNTNNYFTKISILSILCIVLFINCNSLNDTNQIERQNNAIQFARDNSGTNSLRNWEDNYWDNVATYTDVLDYNNAMDLNQTPNLKYTSTQDAWHWASDSLRIQFNQMRIELNN